MKYYQLATIFLLLLVLLLGRFFISPALIVHNVWPTAFSDSQWPKAKIYSTYPFNNRAEIVIGAGINDGVKEAMGVMVDGDFLLGQIVKVYENYSVVRTIFDPTWRLSVRIGPREVDALLEGGFVPHLTMIAKDAPIAEGQVVYSASKDFKYGLPLGKIHNITDSSTAVFLEGELETPYSLNQVREVIVISN